MEIQNFKTKVSGLAGISLVNHYFNKVGLSELIDNELGMHVKYVGYQYSEIFRNLANVFLSGVDVIKDINTHFREHRFIKCCEQQLHSSRIKYGTGIDF
jgi:hypothetical protein